MSAGIFNVYVAAGTVVVSVVELIVEAKDTEKEEYKKLDWLVAEALTIVAGSANSINSPYHQQDILQPY